MTTVYIGLYMYMRVKKYYKLAIWQSQSKNTRSQTPAWEMEQNTKKKKKKGYVDVFTLSVANSNVPSACIKGCWILTSIPESKSLDLHRGLNHDKNNKNEFMQQMFLSKATEIQQVSDILLSKK